MDDYINILENSQGIVKFVLLLFTNVIIGAVGFIPSAFVTATNLTFYGILQGTLLSFIGEVIGTQIGFHLYKKGVSKINPTWKVHSYWSRMQNNSVHLVFMYIIIFRFLPFMPAGLVTAGAAFTSIGKWHFMLASTIGKVPSVLIEVAIINGLMQTFNFSIYSALFIFLCLVFLASIFRRGKI